MIAECSSLFNRIRSATTVTKDRIASLVGLIGAVACGWTALVFGIIFLAGGAIEMADVELRPGDPGYEDAFATIIFALLLAVVACGGLSLILTACVLSPVCRTLTVNADGEAVLHVLARRHEILATSGLLCDRDRRQDAVRVSRDPEEIARAFADSFFWLTPTPEGDVTVQPRRFATVVRIVENIGRERRICSYRIRFDETGLPRRIVVTEERRSGSNSRLTRWFVHDFRTVNRAVAIPLSAPLREAAEAAGIVL